MRDGRVDFKFGETKSVFYFSHADFDVSPSADRSVEVRFSGAPSRTDQSAQIFGQFFIRGTWRDQKLDMRVELEPSALEEVARLLDQHAFGMHGTVAFDAQLSGFAVELEHCRATCGGRSAALSDMPQTAGHLRGIPVIGAGSICIMSGWSWSMRRRRECSGGAEVSCVGFSVGAALGRLGGF